MKNVFYVNYILSNMVGTFTKVIIIALAIKKTLCSVAGISYMDPLKFKPRPEIPGLNPCNPLYWYPKNIPEYCYIKNTPRPRPAPEPIPMPIPVPQPIAIPAPMPPLIPPLISPLPPIPAVPVPAVPLPYGLPIAPSNPMLPVAGAYPQMPSVYPPYPQLPPVNPHYPQVPPYQPPYPQMPPQYSPYSHMSPPYPPFPRQDVGMVPGIPGIVSPDGGINVLPFSDVYSDMLERHKNKLIRKRLQKIAEDYDDFPRIRFQRRRKYRSRMSD